MDANDPALANLLRLPVEERAQAARILLASLDGEHDVSLSPETLATLRARLAAFRENPDAGEDWEQVRASLEA
jgi:putative addiction module component (TIGR02574 family)